MIDIYTDGSARKTKSGASFVVVKDHEIVFEWSLQLEAGTNQAMELLAVKEACEFAANNFPDDDITIFSDSAYLINCCLERWYVSWESNGWLNSRKEPVANQDLWEKIIPFFREPRFSFTKVAGHTGQIYNERADGLATGKVTPNSFDNLYFKKKYDTIYIKLSELLIEYKMNKIPVKEVIDRIINITKGDNNE